MSTGDEARRATVVHVITKLELGGAQENTLETCARLDRSRFSVALVHGPGGILDAEAAKIPDLDVEIVSTLVRPLRPAADTRCLATLTHGLRRRLDAHRRAGGDEHAFVVHTHSSKAGILGRLAARAAGVPVVIHTIHGFGFYEGQPALEHSVFLNAERAVSRITDGFISVSRANLAEARALGIVRSEHEARVIRSGFDLEEIRRGAALGPEIRRELGLADRDEVIVAIANMKPQKDPLTLIEAMRLLVARRPTALLLYAGDGELRGEVEAAIQRGGLGERVRLLGWRRDIAGLLGAADVVALSSIFEGLPKTAVQALVARRPFVGTRVDGTPEVIRDGKNGFLVEPRSPSALASALERALLTRPVDPEDERRVLEWDAATMVRAQEQLYLELIARRTERSWKRQIGR